MRDYQNSWQLKQEQIAELENEISKELMLNENNYKISGEHFDIGNFIHTSEYFFAKRYFQSSKNCDKLALLLANKLVELNKFNTTIIGFRNYLGLVLCKTKILLSDTAYSIDYEIIEQQNGTDLTWQAIPNIDKLEKNIVIVLPITCSCTIYKRLCEYITKYIKNFEQKPTDIEPQLKKEIQISSDFINIFSILDADIEALYKPIIVNERDQKDLIKIEERKATPIEEKLAKLFSDLNWAKICKDSIHFKERDEKGLEYTAHLLVKLYTKLHVPDDCLDCFPLGNELHKEKNIILTNKDSETPNILLGFPISKKQNEDNRFKIEANFTDLFTSKNTIGTPHLFGHITAFKISYLHYIRGNTFYLQNHNYILFFFKAALNEIFKERNLIGITEIIFIASESKHNSTLLDEIATAYLHSVEKNIHILRFDPDNEFVDNFMATYSGQIETDHKLFIYFEEVISEAKTFKLVNNYIKHYRNQKNEKYWESPHGFDYVFTLIDRTSYFKHKEIIFDLFSNTNKKPENCFYSFFTLNVPVAAAAHLGNPLKEKIEHLKSIVSDSHLDVLKLKIGNVLRSKTARELPEESMTDYRNNPVSFFPFEDSDGTISDLMFNTYAKTFTSETIALLKLYISHKINSIISENIIEFKQQNNSENIVLKIIEKIIYSISKDKELFFSEEKDLNKRNEIIEQEIILDNVIKTLSRYPFTYYKKIFEGVFKYCLNKIESLRKSIVENQFAITFHEFRKLRFYFKRLIDMDSSYLISKDFILLIYGLYNNETLIERNKIQILLSGLVDELNNHENPQNENTMISATCKRNLRYKIEQINSFPSFILYLFKESIYKNHYRSVRLENIVNSEELLPCNIENPTELTSDLEHLIKNPYYHITGMIKAENIYLLNKLKELHKNKYKEYIAKLINKDQWLDPDDPDSIINYYFNWWTSNQVIINARNFVTQSRHKRLGEDAFNNVRLSIANMLKVSTELMPESFDINFRKSLTDVKNNDAVKFIRIILSNVVKIIQPGIDEAITEPGKEGSNIDYALYVAYKEKSSEIGENNTFVITSAGETPLIQLSPIGLLYNIIYGLYDYSKADGSDELQGMQSLLAAVKIGENFYSFQDSYYISKDKSLKFNELMQEDIGGDAGNKGLSILKNAEMCLFFRLARLDTDGLTRGEFKLDGEAVLVITCSKKATLQNYLDFMSNEKIRLLLLIKEELLVYLKKIFDSGIFIDLVQKKSIVDLQSSMRHMLPCYFEALEDITSKLKNQDKRIFRFLSQTIQHHISTKIDDISDQTVKAKYSQTDIEELFDMIMRLPYLSDLCYQINDYEKHIKIDTFECHKKLFGQVFPELIINMRRAADNLNEIKPIFRIYTNNNKIFFENNYDKSRNSVPLRKDLKQNGGIIMCENILEKLELPIEYNHPKESDLFRVIITLK